LTGCAAWGWRNTNPTFATTRSHSSHLIKWGIKMIDVWALVGKKDTRKTSTIRALTGASG
jgi:hypothetical protein